MSDVASPLLKELRMGMDETNTYYINTVMAMIQKMQIKKG
jgi:hypothetical protein